jgi:hypothetical protein
MPDSPAPLPAIAPQIAPASAPGSAPGLPVPVPPPVFHDVTIVSTRKLAQARATRDTPGLSQQSSQHTHNCTIIAVIGQLGSERPRRNAGAGSRRRKRQPPRGRFVSSFRPTPPSRQVGTKPGVRIRAKSRVQGHERYNGSRFVQVCIAA